MTGGGEEPYDGSMEPAALGSFVGRHLAHAMSAGLSERAGDRLHPAERMHRVQEAVHGGGVHGSGVWTTENVLKDWHLQNSLKYKGSFHPEYSKTPVPISHMHYGLHDASMDFKSAVRGIVPGCACGCPPLSNACSPPHPEA